MQDRTPARSQAVRTAALQRWVGTLFGSRRIGWALVIGCAIGFAGLATLVLFSEGLLLDLDHPVHDWVVERRTGWVTELMTGISLLGDRRVIGPLVVALAGWMLLTGRCRVIAVVILVAFALNPVVEVLMKEVVIRRLRPDIVQLIPGRGASFPSGHILATVGFYGLLPALVARATPAFRIRLLTFAGASLLILAMGYSRMYLGLHWLTDVLGGYLLGTIVVVATYAALGQHRLDERVCGSGSRLHRLDYGGRAPSTLAR